MREREVITHLVCLHVRCSSTGPVLPRNTKDTSTITLSRPFLACRAPKRRGRGRGKEGTTERETAGEAHVSTARLKNRGPRYLSSIVQNSLFFAPFPSFPPSSLRPTLISQFTMSRNSGGLRRSQEQSSYVPRSSSSSSSAHGSRDRSHSNSSHSRSHAHSQDTTPSAKRWHGEEEVPSNEALAAEYAQGLQVTEDLLFLDTVLARRLVSGLGRGRRGGGE